MAQVMCEVGPGLRESERTVAVRDVQGRRQFLRVHVGFVAEDGGQKYLPVGLVGLDGAKKLALIELPHESDSGVNRLWVRMDELRDAGESEE